MVKTKPQYSPWVGFKKSVQNVAITVGIPAVTVLINSYTEWLPKEWYPIAVPVLSILAYFVKNWQKNKNLGK